MSDIIRRAAGMTPVPENVATATTKGLALLCHEAEDAADDVLLVDVYAELERRIAARLSTHELFMDWYRLLWRERHAQKERTNGP